MVFRSYKNKKEDLVVETMGRDGVMNQFTFSEGMPNFKKYFDEDGHEVIEIYKDGVIQSKTISEGLGILREEKYESGQLIERYENSNNPDGTIEFSKVHTYNEKGQETERKIYDYPNGEKTIDKSYEYAYDEKGQKTGEKEYRYKDGKVSESYEFVYNEKGQKTGEKECSYPNGEKTIDKSYEYAYDEKGQKTGEKEYRYKDGKVSWSDEYAYNEKSQCTERKHYVYRDGEKKLYLDLGGDATIQYEGGMIEKGENYDGHDFGVAYHFDEKYPDDISARWDRNGEFGWIMEDYENASVHCMYDNGEPFRHYINSNTLLCDEEYFFKDGQVVFFSDFTTKAEPDLLRKPSGELVTEEELNKYIEEIPSSKYYLKDRIEQLKKMDRLPTEKVPLDKELQKRAENEAKRRRIGFPSLQEIMERKKYIRKKLKNLEAQEKAKSDKASEVQAEEKGQPQAKSEQRSAGNEMGLKERLMVSEQEAFAQEPQPTSPPPQSAHTLAEKRKEAREKGYYGKVPGGIDDVLAKAETEQNAHIISQTKDKMNS